MNRTKLVLVLGLFLGMFAAAAASAANPPKPVANWDNLKALAPGDVVRVVLNDKKSYRGQFQRLTERAIVVHLAQGDESFDRMNILRVSTKGQSHRLRNTLIGVAVGAAVGGALGASRSEPDVYVYAAYIPSMAVVGAFGGAFVPTGGWHDVYRAR